MTYAERLRRITAERGRLCVGIDPMASVLDAWGLPRDIDGLERCARGIVEEIGTQVAVFKPQSAFFEAFGSRGVAVLERVLADIRGACLRPLRAGRFMTVIVSDVRHGPRFYLYHADLAAKLEDRGWQLKGITILAQDNKNLYPFGVGSHFVSNIHHQYILILQKPKAP